MITWMRSLNRFDIPEEVRRDGEKGFSRRAVTGHRRLNLIMVAIVLSACSGNDTQDLEVDWSVDGKVAVSSCAEQGVEMWRVEARGEGRVVTADIPCGSAWSTNDAFHGLDPGKYTVSVTALDKKNTAIGVLSKETELKPPSTSAENPDDPDPEKKPNRVEIRFYTEIDFFWNINGTVDESDDSDSFDTCDEVKAVHAVITIDGREDTVSCDSGGTMSTRIARLTLGSHSVDVRLLDAAQRDMTTRAAAPVTVDERGARFIADFFYDSFFDPLGSEQRGDFLFQTRFESKTCSETQPVVQFQRSLLARAGVPVNGAMVCNPDRSVCAAADGTNLGVCRSETQVIADQIWGVYSFRIEGVVGDASEGLDCWESSVDGSRVVDILIGAGVENPIETFDLDRVRLEGLCAR